LRHARRLVRRRAGRRYDAAAKNRSKSEMLTMEVKVIEPRKNLLSKGTAGIRCHVSGQCATVSALAGATGGIGNGRLVETSIG
jgi:hypothetical protein